MIEMAGELLGRDLKINFDADLNADLEILPHGDLAIVEGYDNLAQAILNRLRTRLGELRDIGHPGYGSKLYNFVGRPNSPAVRDAIRIAVRDSLMREPRIEEIMAIRVVPARENPNRVDIHVIVKPIGSKNMLNLVFPFYLEVL
ncbi:MAG: hypothetical protein B6U95_03000 [Thermofilum sp. ex4484_82]|nr:MAG: hypothetical protein B6U95_03000 [Thermofilum sp. ex4484_82]